MTKPMGKREIKAMIAREGVWTYTDGMGRRWDIANDSLYCNNEWQSRCADHEALKSIARWADANSFPTA